MINDKKVSYKKVVICPYCNDKALLVSSEVIYGTHWGNIWLCKPCNAYVGCHKTGDGKSPLGTLANRELRYYRQTAHKAFDPLWLGDTSPMGRKEAYSWLSERLGTHKRDTHIARFGIELCKRVIREVEARNTGDK